MEDFDEQDLADLAIVSETHDRRAITVCREVAPMVEPGSSKLDPAPYGVKFEYGDGETWFRATVHHVTMIVRYEQLIETVNDKDVLKGVFRARLDEKAKADQKLISWFSFDINAITSSDGNVVKNLIRDKFDRLTIRNDLAVLIARDVRQHIKIPSRRATISNLKY